MVDEKDPATGQAREYELGEERLEALAAVLERFENEKKIAIWARFHRDIEAIVNYIRTKKLGGFVTYYGGTPKADRAGNLDRWMKDDRFKFFIATAATGGTGLNLQGACRTVIYYSNSFNSVHRWQSEDRFHRIGTIHPVNYVDIVARNTVDIALLNNLQAKKQFADLVLATLEEA